MSRSRSDSKNALLFVLITVMINSIGFGIMIPVLPNLIKELTGLENSEAVWHSGYLTLTYAFLQFICMPIVGGLSDRFGRRPIMLISLAGLAMDYFLIALAPTILWLYAGRAFSGMFGATFSTANAYVADVSPPEKRAQNFGLIGASFGVGFLLGPVIGGILGEYGTRVPFYAAGVISLINVIYGFFFLPETLAKTKRRAFSIKRSNPVGSLISLGRIRGVKSLIFVMFVLATAHTVYPTTYTFSTMEGLGWTPEDVGFSLGAFAVASMIVQGGLIRIIIPKIGLFWAGFIGIASAVIGYTMMGSADAGWIIYAAGPMAALAGLYGPALTNMMSSRVSESEQGELQGAIGAAQGLALMAGPLAMTGSFAIFGDTANRALRQMQGFPENILGVTGFVFSGTETPYIPGAPFLVAGSLSLLALIIFLFVTTKADRDARYAPDKAPNPDPDGLEQPAMAAAEL